MPTEVSILKRNGAPTYYSSYSDARDQASPGDLIQIWANLDEQILLMDGVDIWVAPGVTLDRTGQTPTIVDNIENEYEDAVNCKIYGYAKIKNFVNSEPFYECILTINSGTQLSVECDSIEGLGGGTPNNTTITGSSIFISKGEKFHLKCNSVDNQKTAGIYLGSKINDASDEVPDVNINVIEVKISGTADNPQAFGVLTSASGFVKIDKVFCNHHGHCLLHLRGDILAEIRSLKNVTNHISDVDAVVILEHGITSKRLILYFDEILAQRTSSFPFGPGCLAAQGTCILNGRIIYSSGNYAVQFNGPSTLFGSVTCNELISDTNSAIQVGPSTNSLIIDSNLIHGSNNGESGTIYSNGLCSYTLLNAKIINSNADSNSRGISLFTSGGYPNLTLRNVEIVTEDTEHSGIIYRNSNGTANVLNYGIFGNHQIESGVSLKIGSGPMNSGNFLYIVNAEVE